MRKKEVRKNEAHGKKYRRRRKRKRGEKILAVHVNTFKRAVLPTTKYFPGE